MTLPAQVQALADQLLAALRLPSDVRPESVEIHFAPDGVVTAVKPQLSYRRVSDKR